MKNVILVMQVVVWLTLSSNAKASCRYAAGIVPLDDATLSTTYGADCGWCNDTRNCPDSIACRQVGNGEDFFGNPFYTQRHK